MAARSFARSVVAQRGRRLPRFTPPSWSRIFSSALCMMMSRKCIAPTMRLLRIRHLRAWSPTHGFSRWWYWWWIWWHRRERWGNLALHRVDHQRAVVKDIVRSLEQLADLRIGCLRGKRVFGGHRWVEEMGNGHDRSHAP